MEFVELLNITIIFYMNASMFRQGSKPFHFCGYIELHFVPAIPGWLKMGPEFLMMDALFFPLVYITFEPPREKTNNLLRRKQRRRSASR